MRTEYTLVKDIVSGHSKRMNNIKKYYPFFKVSEISFLGFKEGKYENLDMGYILMAVLRFFIEQNNFNEKDVKYEDYQEFMHDLYIRDFSMNLDKDEEKELSLYIFDKIRNDGRPFSFTYFDPEDKKKKTIRTRIIENKISGDDIVYQVSADAVSFYLDTKEIKEESNISVAQVLLGKMIESRNFSGGTEVILKINNEVMKLINKKNEIINVMSYDVFHGVKMYEDFMENTVKWFENEQKLFKKNKELVDKALKNCDSDKSYYSAMEDIYHLEEELNKAMIRHSQLLSASVALQDQVDGIILKNKLSKIRVSFDFNKTMSEMISRDDIRNLRYLVWPLFKFGVSKTFSLSMIDNMLDYKTDDKEQNEKIKKEKEDKNFKYADEIEDERIRHNYNAFLKIMFEMLLEMEEFSLRKYNERLVSMLGDRVLENGDYFSFLAHLSQKYAYDMKKIAMKPDTFLEGIMKDFYVKNKDDSDRYSEIAFDIKFTGDVIEINENSITDILFTSAVIKGGLK